MTDRAKVIFKVKEYPDGAPWLALEPINKEMNILNNGLIGFDLPSNSSYESAQKIADLLNESIDQLTYTENI